MSMPSISTTSKSRLEKYTQVVRKIFAIEITSKPHQAQETGIPGHRLMLEIAAKHEIQHMIFLL